MRFAWPNTPYYVIFSLGYVRSRGVPNHGAPYSRRGMRLYYKAQSSKSLTYKTEDSQGCKRSKERITLLLAAKMSDQTIWNRSLSTRARLPGPSRVPGSLLPTLIGDLSQRCHQVVKFNMWSWSIPCDEARASIEVYEATYEKIRNFNAKQTSITTFFK